MAWPLTWKVRDLDEFYADFVQRQIWRVFFFLLVAHNFMHVQKKKVKMNKKRENLHKRNKASWWPMYMSMEIRFGIRWISTRHWCHDHNTFSMWPYAAGARLRCGRSTWTTKCPQIFGHNKKFFHIFHSSSPISKGNCQGCSLKLKSLLLVLRGPKLRNTIKLFIHGNLKGARLKRCSSLNICNE